MSLPYDYFPAVMYAIDKISQGYTRTAACDEANINIPLFDSYIKNNPILQDLLMESETRGYDAMADALVNIDNHAIYGQTDPKMAKVISDNIKFLISKRKPKEYGDRVVVEHNITADRAIVDALIAGRQRAALSFDDRDIIDVQVISQSEEEVMAEILS